MSRFEGYVGIWATAAAVLLVAGAAWADLDNNLGLRDDEQLLRLAGQLDNRLEKRNHLQDLAGVVLLRDDVVVCAASSHDLVRGLVVRLGKDPDGDTYERAFLLPPDIEVTDVSVWRIRKDKLKRFEDVLWTRGTSAGGPGLVFRVPDLKQGDQVGFAYVEKHASEFSGMPLPLWLSEPVMMCRVRVRAATDVSFRIEGWHLGRDGWGLKSLEEREGLPVDERFTMMDIGGAADLGPDVAPWSKLPFLVISPRARWVEQMGRWYETESWHQVAIGISGMAASLDKEAPAFRTAAEQAVGEAATPDAEAAALMNWVRDRYETVTPFDRGYDRGEMGALLTADRATAGEQSMVLYMLGSSLGLEFDILATRGRDYGAIRRGTPDMTQFRDVIVRLPGDVPLYYFPADAACAAGAVPERLRGCDALLVRKGLMEQANEIQQEVMKGGAASPEQFQQMMMQKIHDAGFAVWETLP